MQGLGNENYQMNARPKTIMCYICGREYGTLSLPIHMRTCEEKWHIQESKKPQNQRRPLPQPPMGFNQMMNNGGNISSKDIEQYNNVAFNQYNSQALVPCNNCGRTFKPESLVHHAKACKPGQPLKKLPGGASGNNEKGMINQFPDIEKSSQQLVPCQFCGRKFLAERLDKHQSVCPQQTDQPTNRGTSAKKLGTSNTTGNLKVEERRYKPVTQTIEAPPIPQRPQTLVCFICGREYGTSSLKIHIKVCEEQWLIEENKQPKGQRRQVPKAPQGLIDLMNKSEITDQDLEQYNNKAFQSYNFNGLQPCKNCGRTFKPEALVHHKKACTPENPFQPLDNRKGNEVGESENLEAQTAVLRACKQCGRQFAEERLSKHESVCKAKPANTSASAANFTNNSSKIMSSSSMINTKSSQVIKSNSKYSNDKSSEMGSTTEIDLSESKNFSSTPNISGQKGDISSELPRPQTGKSIICKTKTQYLQYLIQFLIGYICGKGYDSQVLPNHIKICKDNWEKQELKKPEKERKSIQPAVSLSYLLENYNIGLGNIDIKESESKSTLIPSKETKEDYQLNQIQEEDVDLQDTAGAGRVNEKIKKLQNSKAPVKTQTQEENPQLYSNCYKCQGRFAQDKIAKHEIMCRGNPESESRDENEENSYEKEDQLDLKKCEICNLILSNEGYANHQQRCKIEKNGEDNQTQRPPVLKPKKSLVPVEQPQKIIEPDIDYEQNYEDAGNLVKCHKCGRNFNSDRINKHEQVCKGETLKKQKKPSPTLKAQPQKPKNSKWRVQHEEFIENMKYMKVLKQVQEAGGDIRSLPPPPKSKIAESYIECPYCKRRFNEQASEKHIRICKNVINKPKPVPKTDIIKDKKGINTPDVNNKDSQNIFSNQAGIFNGNSKNKQPSESASNQNFYPRKSVEDNQLKGVGEQSRGGGAVGIRTSQNFFNSKQPDIYPQTSKNTVAGKRGSDNNIFQAQSPAPGNRIIQTPANSYNKMNYFGTSTSTNLQSNAKIGSNNSQFPF